MFDIAPSEIPSGVDYQWVLKSVMGDDNFSQLSEMEKAGWRRVPLARHPQFADNGSDPRWIVSGGQWLMERPKLLTERAREHERGISKARINGLEDPKRTKTVKEFATLHVWRAKSFARKYFSPRYSYERDVK